MATDPATEVTFPGEFIGRWPTKHEIQVFALLVELCRHFRSAGTYEWPQTMANQIGISVRSVELALAKFVRWGFVEIESVVIGGQPRKIYWCRWLYQDYSRGEFDFGHGVLARIEPGISCDAPMAQNPRKEFAPRGRPKQTEPKKTTDKGRSSSSFVQVSESREETPEPPPAPPLDPRIETELLRVESEADREAIRREAAAWTALYTVELVIQVIVALREKRAKQAPIGKLGAWLAGTLDNKLREAKSPKALKAEAAKAQADARSERERREAEGRRAIHEADLKLTAAKELWRTASEAAKAAIRAEYERDNPRPPGRGESGVVKVWVMGREAWCVEEFATRNEGAKKCPVPPASRHGASSEPTPM